MFPGQEEAPMGVGGVPQGPSHDQGGMPIIDPATGEKKAEIEGGERIFSVEDTQQMEQMAQAIMQAGDPEQQQQAAMQLGMFVVEAISRQEQAQGGEQPAFGRGGRFNLSRFRM